MEGLEQFIKDSQSWEDLDMLLGKALQMPRERRVMTRAAICERSWQLLERSIVDACKNYYDYMTLWEERKRLLDIGMSKRSLFGGIDRFVLETRFQEMFRRQLEPLLGEPPAGFQACRGRDCKYAFEGSLHHIRCPICPWRGCLKCGGSTEHSDCGEYAIALKALEEAGVECKPCPNCLYMMSKDGGCDRMRCEACGRQFDWTTGNTGKNLTIEHIWVKEEK